MMRKYFSIFLFVVPSLASPGEKGECSMNDVAADCDHDQMSALQQHSILSVREDAVQVSLRFQKYDNPRSIPVIDYPLTEDQTRTLLRGTAAVSPRWFEHNQVTRSLVGFKEKGDAFTWIKRRLLNNSATPYMPTHPKEGKRFWSEFEEVVAAQLMRRNKALTKDIMTVHPLFDEDETMDTSAQRVRADFPPHFPIQQILRFLSQGMKLDDEIFRRPECAQDGTPEFVNGAVALGGIAGWAITQVSPVAFASKWHVGRMRPEEVARWVSQGRLAQGANKRARTIRSGIRKMNLSHAAEFTAYEEGSPVHPSWPAMHSAASSLSSWLDAVADLTPAQREEARLLDYSIAYFRTLAGVHYESDNRAGLAMGKGIVESKLPGFLANMYSCDEKSAEGIRRHVKDKIKRNDLDWSTWLPPHWKKPTLF